MLLFDINIVVMLLGCHDIDPSLVIQFNITIFSNFIIGNLCHFFLSTIQKSIKWSQQKLNRCIELFFCLMFCLLSIFISHLKWHELTICSIFCISDLSNTYRLRLAALVIFCRHAFFKSPFACFLHSFCQHGHLILYPNKIFQSASP